MSIDDWRYDDHKMKVREQALVVLMSKFGGQMEGAVPKYSQKSIYECAHDWVSQGNMHQLMYEMATSNWNTVAETQGGSENFQGGSENVHR